MGIFQKDGCSEFWPKKAKASMSHFLLYLGWLSVRPVSRFDNTWKSYSLQITRREKKIKISQKESGQSQKALKFQRKIAQRLQMKYQVNIWFGNLTGTQFMSACYATPTTVTLFLKLPNGFSIPCFFFFSSKSMSRLTRDFRQCFAAHDKAANILLSQCEI